MTRRNLIVLLALTVCLVAPLSADGSQAPGPTGTIAVNGGGTPLRAIYLVSLQSGTRTVRAPDNVFDFDLSPDGREIAVAGFTGIWVIRRDGTSPRRIFDGRKLQYGAGAVQWARSGDRLAFVRRDSLFALEVSTKHLLRVTNRADSPDWLPDGRRIVFVRDPETSSRDGVVSSIGADGRGLRRIVTRGRWFGPRVSPDGSKVAFYRNGVSGIFIAPAKGGAPRLFVRNGTMPEWSPDGRYLAFTREIDCGEAVCTSRIFIVPAVGGKAHAYGPPIVDIGPLSWSR